MKTIIYSWKESAPYTAKGKNPQVVGERLDAIRLQHDGALKNEYVVEDAKDEASPLHEMFEWNDQTAARRYRLRQASDIICHLDVTISKEGERCGPIRAFVTVAAELPSEEESYESVISVLSDHEKLAKLLNKAVDELEQWKHKHQAVRELNKLFEFIDRVTVKVREKFMATA